MPSTLRQLTVAGGRWVGWGEGGLGQIDHKFELNSVLCLLWDLIVKFPLTVKWALGIAHHTERLSPTAWAERLHNTGVRDTPVWARTYNLPVAQLPHGWQHAQQHNQYGCSDTGSVWSSILIYGVSISCRSRPVLRTVFVLFSIRVASLCRLHGRICCQ